MKPDSVEIVCDPSVTVVWAVVATTYPAAGGETTVSRHTATTTLLVETLIAEHLQGWGDDVARIEHSFHGRDVHLRDGARVEYRWQCYITDWRCLDCGVNTSEIDEYYMLHDPIWHQANPNDDGMLCIGCVESRLGRPLRATDFTPTRVNDATVHHRSSRMIDRLRRRDPASAADSPLQ
jgi:hypothetical protein